MDAHMVKTAPSAVVAAEDGADHPAIILRHHTGGGISL